ncbi:hypothetical protein ACFPES_30695 [Paenibacillus sp. GCM10023248]|uniref:hypothetical protein n=1 Tax=Bacillales TaxID=1385 RepID=UPI002379DC4E|nr:MULTISPECIES: hypothetical protein [Bacillales]MDD9271411.1 hypothetical protein [Paenibacillus sp. MAHUQ-63]MDR6884374.1 hypothetical protein [Bacillus sp. 3255]
MLTIQLGSKLQNVVHTLKNLELVQAGNSLATAAGALSKEESNAVLKTFTNREKKQTEPICNWF